MKLRPILALLRLEQILEHRQRFDDPSSATEIEHAGGRVPASHEHGI
jgi:hypothetical protein